GSEWTAIVAPELKTQFGDYTKRETVIGSGPFILKDWAPVEKEVYVRNPDYYDPNRPYLDGMTNTRTADAAQGDALFLQEQRANATKTQDQARALQRSKANLMREDVDSQFLAGLVMRVDQPPFTDVRVRRALSLLLDRKALIDKLQLGKGNIT